MFRILHLSDVHIGKTYKEPKSIAYQIVSDIYYNGVSNIDCIVVTGDIFDGQAKEPEEKLINEAVDFFEILQTEINLNQEEKQLDKSDFIFVPGNHDLIRVDDCKLRWKKYHDFLKRFYGEIPSFYNGDNYSLLKIYDEKKVVLVGFNSCEIKKKDVFDDKFIGKFEEFFNEDEIIKNGIYKETIVQILKKSGESEYDDYGHIHLSQITPIERKIKEYDDFTVVALFHHHFSLFPEVVQQFGDSSLIHNYTEVIQHLRYMNVNVVLHGVV